MVEPILIHGVLLTISALSTGSLSLIARRFDGVPGARGFFGLMVTLTTWIVAFSLGTLFFGIESRILFERAMWFGIAFVPVCYFVFALEYTGHGDFVTRKALIVLSAFPVVTLVALWTNPIHGLLWPEFRLVETSGMVFFHHVDFGPWFYAFTFYSYALIGISSFLLVRTGLSGKLFRNETILLLVGVFAPVLANAQSILSAVSVGIDLTPFVPAGIDLTPYAFTISGLAFGWAMFRHNLFETTPAPRRLGKTSVLQRLDDGVLLAGEGGEVLYSNAVANRILGDEAVGESVSVPELLEPEMGHKELEIGERVYDAIFSPISGGVDPLGFAVILRDVTEQRKRGNEIQRQRDETESLQELNGVTRTVNRILARASTREEVGKATCRELTTSRFYQYACIQDAHEGTVADSTPLAGETLYSSGTVSDSGDEGAWTSLPIRDDWMVYWQLSLYTERRDGFGHQESEVLNEIGKNVGKTLTLLERSRLLIAEEKRAIEMEFQEGVLVEATNSLDSSLSLDQVVPAADGIIVFLLIEGEIDAVIQELEGSEHVAICREVEEGTRIEIRLTGGSLILSLVEFGGHVDSLDVADGNGNVVAEFPRDASLSPLVRRIQSTYPSAELVSKAITEKSVEPRANDTYDLTEKQWNTLAALSHAGYFDWPRTSTAEDVAQAMGVSPSTLHKHLRRAQKKIFESLF